MQINDVLALLDNVKKSGKGYSARCPAHKDKNPSLSVREGEKGILVHCWAGCTLESICAALGISVSNLFYDDHQPPDWETIQKREREKQKIEKRNHVNGLLMDARREADRFLQSMVGVDISRWTEAQKKNSELVWDALSLVIEEEGSYGKL